MKAGLGFLSFSVMLSAVRWSASGASTEWKHACQSGFVNTIVVGSAVAPYPK